MKDSICFAQWSHLLAYVDTGKELYYHAPLDRFPVRVEVMKKYKNGKLRIKVKDSRHGGFIVDVGHLDRFCKIQFDLNKKNDAWFGLTEQ